MRRPPEFACYAEYCGMEGRTEYQLFTSRDVKIIYLKKSIIDCLKSIFYRLS